MVTKPAIKDHVAAISAAASWKGEAVLDLDYDEDSTAETDANFVLTGAAGWWRFRARPKARRSPTSNSRRC